MIVALIVILSVICTSLVCYCKIKHKYWQERDVPFVQPTLLFGSLLTFIFDNDNLRTYLKNTFKIFHGPYYGFFVFTKPFLVIQDLEIIRNITITNFSNFPNKLFLGDEKCDQIFGRSIFTKRDDEWRSLRLKLSGIFTNSKLKNMVNFIQRSGENLERYLETILDKDVEVTNVVSKYSLSLISSSIFGIDIDYFDTEVSNFQYYSQRTVSKGVIGVIKNISYVFVHPLVKTFKYSFLDPTGVKYLAKVFLDVLKNREVGNKRNDFIDVLLSLKNSKEENKQRALSYDMMVAQAILFFTAGHETTTATITFTLHELSLNPTIQNRARQEINVVLKRHNGNINYNSLHDMKYLDMIIRETLRKYPIISFLHRETRAPYVIPQTGLKLDCGTAIIVPIQSVHYNPKYYPNPNNYDPERFNDENIKKGILDTFLPFGIGPRHCLGEKFAYISMKAGLLYILRRFQVESNSKTRKLINIKTSYISSAKGGVHLSFKKL
ncbi:hypothetical protein RI129_005378 [Pyrocoelia pectoralis]|uniref:Cytochrome P450 n=1 Tax=Pyrocoelia pectoralis TaxID=417401 RepID=A0AAN7VI43_9COLE